MTDVTGLAPAVLFQCLVSMPLILVWLVTGVLIAQRVQNNRTAAFMALGGIVLAAVDLAVGIANTMFAPLLIRQGTSMTNTGMLLSVIGVVQTLIAAVAWGLILAALVMALGKPDGEDGPIGED